MGEPDKARLNGYHHRRRYAVRIQGSDGSHEFFRLRLSRTERPEEQPSRRRLHKHGYEPVEELPYSGEAIVPGAVAGFQRLQYSPVRCGRGPGRTGWRRLWQLHQPADEASGDGVRRGLYVLKTGRVVVTRAAAEVFHHGGGGSVAPMVRGIALARNYGHPVTSCGVQVFL